jgi:dolichol-phosphate mannosyltransferase
LAPPERVCVVVPTYNEKDNITPLVDSLERAGVPGLSLLFVDDGSPDGTAEEAERLSEAKPWIDLLRRPRKMGIGSAYQDGFKVAISSIGPDVLVEMDADLQHPASALPGLVEAVNDGADVAIASRYIPGGGISGWGRLRRVVSRGANTYARFMLRLKVKDATSGYRAFSKAAAEAVAQAELPAKGFEFQVATLHLLKDKWRIVEVPFTFTERTAGKSKLGLADVAKFLVAVLRMAF